MKKGRNGKILFDTIDLDIMLKVKDKPQGIMELKELVGLEHKNLKAHLTRLTDRNLIKRTPVPKSRKIILSIPKKKKIKTIFDIFS